MALTKVTDPVADLTTVPSADNADTVDGQHASEFAASSHNHDSRYYTESEVDAIIAGITHNTTTKVYNWAGALIYTGGGLGNVYLNYSQHSQHSQYSDIPF